MDATDFLRDFAAMSAFGATPDGGVDREALTEADVAQRRWFAGRLEEQGFRVEYDRVGNQFGLLERVPGAPYVLVGSHMDSQPTAGRFDGAYGVLAALHAVTRTARALGDEGVALNLGVVNWFNEEGSRFAPSMMGSSVYTGLMPAERALDTTDRHGVSVREALATAGFDGAGTGPRAAAYAEIHVEQGRELENAGSTIGVVTATWAAHKFRVVVHGEQAHSGATLMEDRRDALLGASMLVVAAREIADARPGVVHTAVGQLDVYPNSPVVVASRVTLLLDIRSADVDAAREAAADVAARIERIEELARVHIESTETHAWGINAFDEEGAALTRLASEARGIPHQDVLTVAGHDSVNMKEIVPTVMIFVPSVAGISHNTQEFTRDEDLVAGVDVLTDVVGDLARGRLTAPDVRPED